MANALYGLGRQKFLECDAGVDWATADIACYLLDTAYSVSIDTHEFRDSIGTPTSTSGNLASKTTTLGVADAADLAPAFSTVLVGEGQQSYVVIANSGTAGTSPLIVYIDTATGLPVTPNGGDINITWDSGASKIFKL